MMKRAIKRWVFLLAITALGATAAMAQQPTATPAPANDTQKDKKAGSGTVPPGVKLAPEMPLAGAPKPFQFPEPATKTLANGLRVFVVTDHREPAVAARLVILSAGSIQDPGGMPGGAGTTAGLLARGPS